jgi:carboxyl-terminal processing protease
MMNNPVGAVLVPSVTNVFFACAAPPATVVEERAAAVVSRMLDGGVGYLAVHVFAANVPALVYDAVHRLSARGMASLILDLRGNPGGELHAFVELAGDFLEPGTEIVTMIDVDGDETVYRATQPSPYRFPVAVLVDGDTASAAELFAAALKAHGRASIVGETTYGTGVAEAVVATPGGAAVHGRVAAFRFPDEECVQGEGLQPDLPFPPCGQSGALPAPLCAALVRLASKELVAHRP